MSATNRQILLAARPSGVVQPGDWEHHTAPVEEPGPGRFAGRTRVISLDPAMRGWLDDRDRASPSQLVVVMEFLDILRRFVSTYGEYRDDSAWIIRTLNRVWTRSVSALAVQEISSQERQELLRKIADLSSDGLVATIEVQAAALESLPKRK